MIIEERKTECCMKERILIIGGTGAIGGALVKELSLRSDIEVWVTSRKEHVNYSSIHYIKGSGKNKKFISEVLKSNYEYVIDFMDYSTEEFKDTIPLIINSTKHYFFLSSARVYANTEDLITEESELLLNNCPNEIRNSDCYPIHKILQEEIVKGLCGKYGKRYTILRPYIVYNQERLQLCSMEKERWLYRVMNEKKVAYPEQMGEKYTTMTFGGDVAKIISHFIGNEACINQVVNITSGCSMKWEEIMDIYNEIIIEIMGKSINYVSTDTKKFAKKLGNEIATFYDRMYDRRFDNTKLLSIYPDVKFIPIEEGLRQCIRDFFENPSWKYIDIPDEAYLDGFTNDKISIGNYTIKGKMKYMYYRYIKFFEK